MNFKKVQYRLFGCLAYYRHQPRFVWDDPAKMGIMFWAIGKPSKIKVNPVNSWIRYHWGTYYIMGRNKRYWVWRTIYRRNMSITQFEERFK